MKVIDKNTEFEAYVAQENKIELKDWMPEDYKVAYTANIPACTL